MSTAYAYNVGLGLNFSGQEDEQNDDVQMEGYPQEPSYVSYSHGSFLNMEVLIVDYSNTPLLTASPNGHFVMSRITRPEGIQVSSRSEFANVQTPSPSMPVDPAYLSPRPNNSYATHSRSARFQPHRSHSPAFLASPAGYSPYPPSYCASPATFSGTPLQTSPMSSQLHDNESFAYFHSPQMCAPSDGAHSEYASPMVLQQSSPDYTSDYYGHSPLVSPPITPMESHGSFASQMSSIPIKMEFERYEEYPLSPYTPTYPQHLKLPEPSNSGRPVSAGRLASHGEYYATTPPSGLKRAVSLNSARFTKSVSPPRSVASSSPPTNKRPAYSKWTAEEDEMLRNAIANHGTSKWSVVASMVTGRTAMQCSTRWQGALNTTIHKGKWEPEEDRILIGAVDKWRAEHPPQSPEYDSDDEDDRSEAIPWGLIAAMLPRRRTGIQCQARWSEALDPTVRKGKWTPEEDEMLFNGVGEHGQCWIKVASKVRGRTQRQIRTRWMQIRGRERILRV
jgi:hypothetical protein